MKRKWIDKKVLILGLSKSGSAAARYLSSQGADCYITEFKPLQDKDKKLFDELQKDYNVCQKCITNPKGEYCESKVVAIVDAE